MTPRISELAALLDYLERKDLVLIPLEDVRRDLRLRKLADLFAELLLFVCELEVHNVS